MKSLFAKEAAQFLGDHTDALFIDCRSEMEYRFVGHPVGAHQISWLDGAGWEVNPHFVAEVTKLADGKHDRPVMLICRDGNRALAAGGALEDAGFLNVYTVLCGFEGDVGPNLRRGEVNGWRFDGLPWIISACGKCGS
ncbi:rhodanese-like domain-containing protein [Aromatoleum toluolicum]|uniref:Rhodanese-like domain-containing protein n=1 Tax=Aromatoleum toluolicum TaxID=90060 RepID=A0ABX1NML4_9RHOO|nr:rhodanese-like domain-containing protein [Aromatoleum toluolicum]NMG00281.1 rhodanese-like domain-containing protein [Aromatoleum toluolicum]